MYVNFQIPVNTHPADNEVLRIRRGSSIPPALQSYECHFNWAAKHYPNLTLNEIGHGLLLLEEKFRDEAEEMESLLRASSSGITLIAKKLTQAYWNIEIGKFWEAKACLSEAEKFLSRCVNDYFTFSEDYTQGFTYVLEGISLFLEIQLRAVSSPTTATSSADVFPISNNNTRGNSNKVSMDGLKHFRKLAAKAKYIVWTVRDVFLIYSFRSNVQRHNWMEAILEMEPYIPKWHFYLYQALHGVRKLRPRPMPLGLERHVVSDPLSISYQAMYLTQIFNENRMRDATSNILTRMINASKKYTTDPLPSSPSQPQSSTSCQYPARFGTLRFENEEQVLSTIHEKTIEVLEMDCHLDGVYLNLSEIHLFLLPPENQSVELAVRCLKKALRLNSTNTKTHYRMGLALFKLGNVKQATFHFREAIKDPNNIGAVYGLVQILMANPGENSVEIQTIFKTSMKHRDLTRVWDKRCLRTLHYLRGCFHFMQEKEEDSLNEAITSWIIAHDNESPKWSYYFINLCHQSTRFGWPTKRLNLTNVSNALKHAAYLEQTQFKQLLLDICSEVDDAIRRVDEQKNVQ